MLKTLSLSLGSVMLLALVIFAWRIPENNMDQFRNTWFQDLNKQVPATGSLSLQDALLEKKSPELHDLSISLPHYHLYPGEEIRALVDASKTCAAVWKKPLSRDLKKAWQWQKYTCHQQSLPRQFFSTKPFLHPSGKSFVALNEASSDPVILPPAQRRPLMSLVESLQEGDEIQKYLSKNLLTMELLLAENPLVTSSDWVFVKNPKDDNSESYQVYSRSAWDLFFTKQAFNFKSSESQLCVEQYSNGCWVKNQVIGEQHIRLIKLVIIFLLMAIGLILFWSFRRQTRLKTSEEDQRRFALQMLTHELRTPVTSLLLLVENMRSQFDQLPEKAQKDLMRLIDEVRRLQRTTESSEIYLKMDPSQQKSKEGILSAVSLIRKLRQSHLFKSVISDENLKITGNAELLEFCLSNLLRNAHRHGRSPVTLSVICSHDEWVLEVKDEGVSPRMSLQELAQPFLKSERSQGLGLGLSLVSEICKKHGWKFLLTTHPTRFSIHLPRASGEKQP